MKLGVGGFLIVIGMAAALGLTLLTLYIWLVLSRGELGEKRGAAYLQGFEFKYRKTDFREPFVLWNAEGSGYNVLVVPTDDTKYPHAWIILNEAAPMSQVYLMPGDVRYYVSCSFVNDLSAKTQIVPQVLDALRKACTP